VCEHSEDKAAEMLKEDYYFGKCITIEVYINKHRNAGRTDKCLGLVYQEGHWREFCDF
jgi:hypothetical protein